MDQCVSRESVRRLLQYRIAYEKPKLETWRVTENKGFSFMGGQWP